MAGGDGVKIYVLCDLEGTAGVVDFQTQTYADSKYNEQAKTLATLELNALVDGALEGGATEVIVLDGHGSGGIDIAQVHPEAQVLYGRPLPKGGGLDRSYAALFLYGHHAMNNVPTGVLCHSWSSRTIANCWLNGELIGEIGVNVALAGYFGVPTVFISGDRAAVEEGRRYVPDIEGVIVKEGLSRTSALTLAPAKARALIREGARRAMSQIGKIRPYTVPPPYDFRTQYLAAQSADDKARKPDVERVDLHTVKVSGEDFLEVISRR